MASDGQLIFDTKLDSSGFEKGVGSLASKAKEIGGGVAKSADFVKNAVLTGTKAMVAGVSSFGAYSLKAGSDFDAGMSEVQAISGATSDQLQALRDKAKEMGAKTKFSASQSAEALKYMGMAGWKADQMLAGLPGIMNLAAASGEDLGLVSDIVTDSLTAFGMKAEETGRFVDVLAAASTNSNTNVSMLGESFKYIAPVAGALGYTAEDTALALGLMANAGIKSSQSGTSLRASLTRLAKPTKEVKTTMEALGISITNSQGQMLPLKDLMIELRSSFSDLTKEQQAQAAAALFGKEAMSGMLAIINASDEDFNKLAEAINNSTGAAENMAKIMNDNLKGDFTIMMSALEGLGISFYENLDKPMRSVVQSVTKQIDILNQAINNDLASIPQVLGSMIADGAVAIASKAPMMIETGQNIILSFLDGIDSNSDKLADSSVKIITHLVTALLNTGSKLLEVGGKLVLKIGEGLANNAETIAPKALEVIGKLADGFLKALPQMIKIGADIVKGVAKGLKENPQIVAEAVPAILKAFASAMLLFQGVDVAKGLLKSIATGISSNDSLMEAPAKGLIGKLNKILIADGDKLHSTGKGLLSKIAKGISAKSEPIIKAGKDTVDYLGIAILEGRDKLLAPAKGLVTAIGNTVSKIGASSLVQSGLGLVTKIGAGLSSGFGHLTAIAGKIVPLIAGILSNPIGLVVAGTLLIGALIKGFNIDVPKLTHSAGQIIGKIAKTIVSGAGQLLKPGIQLITNIGKGFSSGIQSFIEKGPVELIKNIGSSILSGAKGLWDVGASLISGIKDGWNGNKEEVIEEASQIPNEINDSIDPSLTTETGQSMVEGIIGGVKWGQSSVAEAYGELIQNGINETDAKAILRQEGSLSIQEYVQGILESTGSAKEAYAALMSEGLSQMDAAEQFFEIAGLNMDSFINGTEEGGQTYKEKLEQLMAEGKKPLEAIEELYNLGKENSDSFVQGSEEGGQNLASTFSRMIEAGFTELEVIDQMYQKGQLNVNAFGEGSEAGKEHIIAIYNGLKEAGLTNVEAVEKLHEIGLLNAQGFAEGTSQGQVDVENAMNALIESGLTKTQASELMASAGRSNVDAYVSGVNQAEGSVSGAYDNAFAKPFSILDFFLGDPTQRKGRETGEKYASGISQSKDKVKTEAEGVMKSAEESFSKDTQAKSQGLKIGDQFAGGINESKVKVTNASNQVGQSALSELDKKSLEFRNAGDKAMQSYQSGIDSKKGQIINSINNMSRQIDQSLNNTSNKATSVSSQMMNKMAKEVINGSNKISQEFKRMGDLVNNSISDTKNRITNSSIQMMNKFVNTIKTGANNSINAIKNMSSRMVSSVNSFRGQFQNAGYNLMAGLRSGINGGASGVINAAINVMNRAVRAAKRAASIHSPSKVWQDEIGAMLTLGMAKGIEDKSGEAIKATKTLMENVKRQASNGVDIEVASNIEASGKDISKSAIRIGSDFITSIDKASSSTGETISSKLIESGQSIKEKALLGIDEIANVSATEIGNQLISSATEFQDFAATTIDDVCAQTNDSFKNQMTKANELVGNHTVNLIDKLTKKTVALITKELTKSAKIIASTVSKVIKDLSNKVNDLIKNCKEAKDSFDDNLDENISKESKVLSSKDLGDMEKKTRENLENIAKYRTTKGFESKEMQKTLDELEKRNLANLEKISKMQKAKDTQSKEKQEEKPLDTKAYGLSDEKLDKLASLASDNLENVEKLRKIDESKRSLSDKQLDKIESLNKENLGIIDQLKQLNKENSSGSENKKPTVDFMYKDLVNLKNLNDSNLDTINELRKIEESKRSLDDESLDKVERLSKENLQIIEELKNIKENTDGGSLVAEFIERAKSMLRDFANRDMAIMGAKNQAIMPSFAKAYDSEDITIRNGDITTVIELDGQVLGKAVTPIVSQEMSKDRRRRR